MRRRIRRSTLVVLSAAGLILLACSHDATGPAAPPVIQMVSGGGQTDAWSVTLSSPLVVSVTSGGQPLKNAAVMWTALGTTGAQVSPTVTHTDASGMAQTVLTLGDASGLDSVVASTPHAVPVTFVDTAADPCTLVRNLVPDSSLSGALAFTDCQNSGFYYDTYQMSLTAPVRLQVEEQSTALIPYLLVWSGSQLRALGDTFGLGPVSAVSDVLFAAGTYRILASSADGGRVGIYYIGAHTTPSDVTGCAFVWITPGVTTAQQLSSADCASNGYYADGFVIRVFTGQTLTVTETSTAFAPELFLINAATDSGPAFSGASTVTGTFTAGQPTYIFVYAASVAQSATGSYSLSVGLTGTATTARRAPEPGAMFASPPRAVALRRRLVFHH